MLCRYRTSQLQSCLGTHLLTGCLAVREHAWAFQGFDHKPWSTPEGRPALDFPARGLTSQRRMGNGFRSLNLDSPRSRFYQVFPQPFRRVLLQRFQIRAMVTENPVNGQRDERMDYISQSIREIPDWPKKGILFQDITTMLLDAKVRTTAWTCAHVTALRLSLPAVSCILQS